MIRVCVCTSCEGVAEPRAPRHAAAIAALGAGFEVVFIDSAPIGQPILPVAVLERLPNLIRQTHRFASRSQSAVRLALDRACRFVAQIWFRVSGSPTASALSTRAIGLQKELVAAVADVYVAHQIDTLLPAAIAAERRGALLMFDSMEFHGDMGDGQTLIERKLVREIERRYLPKCRFVFTSSDEIADALVTEYGIKRPIPLYNVPPKEETLIDKPERGLALYWRNAVIGLGQRGLDDALVAMTKLPVDVCLHLQGGLPIDGGAGLRARVAELGLQSRVVFHLPYAPENAVREASQYHVGLCLERTGIRNHELTVSNKMFDYHMAGLAVIASDLPPLRRIVTRSNGGLLFTPGSPEELAEKIFLLYRDRGALRSFAANARQFAMNEGNREIEMQKFSNAIRQACEDLPRTNRK